MTDKCPCCGGKLTAAWERSTPQHRRYFAMIRATFDHWPEYHALRPNNQERLRQWLQVKAGFYDTIYQADVYDLADSQSAVAAMAAMSVAISSRKNPFTLFGQDNGIAYVWSPKSISYRRLGQKNACELFEKVDNVILNETGTSGTEYLEESIWNA